MNQLLNINSLINYVKTAINKRYSYLRITAIWINAHPAWKNPTNTPHASHAQSVYGPRPYVSHAVTHSNLSRSRQHIYTDPLPPRRRAPSTIHSSTTVWSAGSYPASLHNSQWGSGEKTIFCWQPATILTGPISPTCDRYVQYLLTGANPSVLNRHRRGATALKALAFQMPLPDLPNRRSPLSTYEPRPVSSLSKFYQLN
jgi:hypothetical protein